MKNLPLIQRLQQFFTVISASQSHAELRHTLVTALVDCDLKEYLEVLNAVCMDSKYSIHTDEVFTRIIATDDSNRNQAAPPWLRSRYSKLLKKHLQNWKNEKGQSLDLHHLLDIWPARLADVDSESWDPPTKLLLIEALNFAGRHLWAFQLIQNTEISETQTSHSVEQWAKLRGIYKDSRPTPLLTAIEASDRDQIATIVCSRPDIQLPPIYSIFADIIRGFLFLFWRRATSENKQAILDFNQLADDDEHWNLTAKALAWYWFRIDHSVAYASALLKLSLSKRNSAAVVRGLDWTLFCLAHTTTARTGKLGLAILARFTRRFHPALAPDVHMHLAICSYYRGDLDSALKNHGWADYELRHGDHPFNKLINLSSALRTTLTMRLPLITNILLKKVRSLSAFSTGTLALRTGLLEKLNSFREDGVQSDIITALQTCQAQISQTVPIAKGTLQLLCSLAYYDLGDLKLANSFMSEAEANIKRAKCDAAYLPIIAILRTGLAGKSSANLTLPQWISILTSGWRRYLFASAYRTNIDSRKFGRMLSEASFRFQWTSFDTFRMKQSEFHTASTAPNLESSRTGLFQSLLAEGVRNYPEFRLKIINCTEHEDSIPGCPSDLYLPHLAEALKQRSTLMRVRAANGSLWYLVIQKIEWKSEIPSLLIMAAPDQAKQLSLSRALQAQQLLASIESTALRLEAEELQLASALREKDLRATAALGEVATQVAHDIRSPLTALEVLMANRSIDEDTRSLLTAASQRIKGIANSLLTRYKNTQSVDCLIATPIAGLTRAIASEKRLQLAANDRITILERIEPNALDGFASADPQMFSRILSNLLNNSIEAIDDFGLVTVSLQASNSSLQLRVTDTGRGIPDNVLRRLGKKGFSTKQDADAGSGLGLWHAIETVRKWGGQLGIETKVDSGTTVTIELPSCSTPSWYINELKLDSSTKIVVVDDEPYVARLWQRKFDHLGDSGISIKHFVSSSEAAEFFASDKNESYLYLIDHDLGSSSLTGLQLIQSCGIINAHLVTNRWDDPAIQAACSKMQIKLIPKDRIGNLPICVAANKATATAFVPSET